MTIRQELDNLVAVVEVLGKDFPTFPSYTLLDKVREIRQQVELADTKLGLALAWAHPENMTTTPNNCTDYIKQTRTLLGEFRS